MVPHLTTALHGPLLELEQRFLDRMPDIERWLRTHWQEHAVPFYASVDLRNAGFKLAPVDTNLFPGRLQQSESRVPAAVRAGDPGGGRARLRRCARRAARPREPHAQHVLPAERRHAAQHPRAGRHARAHRLADSRPRGAHDGSRCPRAARSRSSRSCATGAASALADFDPCMVLLNNDLSRDRRRCCRASTSRWHRRSRPAGTTGRSRITSACSTRSRRNSARCSTSIRG